MTENSSTIGNWTLLVVNGTVKEFNATLGRYLNGVSGKIFHIGGFTSTAHKHIQLGSFGSHMINGIADFSIDGKMIQNWHSSNFFQFESDKYDFR